METTIIVLHPDHLYLQPNEVEISERYKQAVIAAMDEEIAEIVDGVWVWLKKTVEDSKGSRIDVDPTPNGLLVFLLGYANSA